MRDQTDLRDVERYNLEVVDRQGYRFTRATQPFKPREVVFSVVGQTFTAPTIFTIQVAADCHVLTTCGSYVNHSCQPNCGFDSRQRVFRALHLIQAGDEITFDYHTTEYELCSPFQCQCGAIHCVQQVLGYKHLAAVHRQRLAPWTAAHLNLR